MIAGIFRGDSRYQRLAIIYELPIGKTIVRHLEGAEMERRDHVLFQFRLFDVHLAHAGLYLQ